VPESLPARTTQCHYWPALKSIHHLADELGGIGTVGDLTKQEDLQNLVKRTADTFGRIDAVVNNTGDPPRGDLLDLTDQQWTASVDLILLNVIRMAKLVTPIMLQNAGGAIVNISASDAYEPDQRFPIASTLRAALGAYTKLYSDRYATQNIRMNCVLPGITFDTQPGDILREDIRRRVPMQRQASYSEIAKVVRFLLSNDSSYITGQNLRVDGGLTRGV